MKARRNRRMMAVLVACAVASPVARAADVVPPAASPATTPVAAAPMIRWTLRDTAGRNVAVPVAGQPCVVLSLRAGQPDSAEAVRQTRDVLAKQAGAPVVIVVFSGENRADVVGQFAQANRIEWPIVLDPEYAIAGQMSVHAWPTTTVVSADGTQVAHLAGLPPTYAADLSAYTDLTAGRIDRAELGNRLASRQVVTDSPPQAGGRHLKIATAFLEKGQYEQAKAEIEQGLRLEPNDLPLRLAQVETLLKLRQFDDAVRATDALKNLVPPWQFNLLRAEALIGTGQWAEAKAAAAEAAKLNPHPASAFYLSGLVLSHDQDWPGAADAFRKAYEASQGPSRN